MIQEQLLLLTFCEVSDLFELYTQNKRTVNDNNEQSGHSFINNSLGYKGKHYGFDEKLSTVLCYLKYYRVYFQKVINLDELYIQVASKLLLFYRVEFDVILLDLT